MQKILSYLRKAIEHYNMIEEGDKIAIGLSGGKDSITLVLGLKALQRFYPKHFEIVAISVNPNFEFFDSNFLKEICDSANVKFVEAKSNIKDIVFDIRNEKNPCSLCANLRRGALNSVAIEHNCNKIALGHNLDDALETFLLNTLYTGNISTFAPKAYMDRSQMTVIRPLIFTYEKDIKAFVKRNNITVMEKCCPYDGISKREDMKVLLNNLRKDIPRVKENLFGAILRSDIKGWNEKM